MGRNAPANISQMAQHLHAPAVVQMAATSWLLSHARVRKQGVSAVLKECHLASMESAHRDKPTVCANSQIQVRGALRMATVPAEARVKPTVCVRRPIPARAAPRLWNARVLGER